MNEPFKCIILLLKSMALLSICAGLFGCVKTPQLSSNAQMVKLIMKAEPNSGCEEIGDVSTGNDWYRSATDVKVDLRNKAAGIGANVVSLDIVEKEDQLYGGSGRAFKCSVE